MRHRIALALSSILTLALLIGLLVPAVNMMLHSTDALTPLQARQKELFMLDDAIEKYKLKYGELFPEQRDISWHAIRVFPDASEAAKSLPANGIDSSQLDDAERLVLFLGGDFTLKMGRTDEAIFEFPKSRLVDSDHDGFPEYTTRDGHAYRLRGGRPYVYCEPIDAWITCP